MKRKIILISFFIIIITTLWVTSSIYSSYHSLEVNHYDLSSEMNLSQDELNILILSDLHDHEFGTNNLKLISIVAEQTPDIIFLVGDMLNDYSEDAEVVCSLIEQLVVIAPTYYALGNHELAYMEQHPELLEELQAAGALALEKSYIDTVVAGVPVRIGGMYDYAFFLKNEQNLDDDKRVLRDFLLEFEDTDSFKIMLSHRPDSFIFHGAAEDWDIDLVVSGHNHGGQVVVPFVGGLYGGDQGYFPKYVHGMYEIGNMNVYVTNGLGSNKKILPRFNNRPEVAIINCK